MKIRPLGDRVLVERAPDGYRSCSARPASRCRECKDKNRRDADGAEDREEYDLEDRKSFLHTALFVVRWMRNDTPVMSTRMEFGTRAES